MSIINCPPLIGIDRNCSNNVGGMKTKVYIFPSEKRSALSLDSTDYVVDEVTYVDGSNPVLPVTLSFHKDTANLTESAANTATTANSTNTITLSLTINNRQYSKSKSISILGAGGRELDIYIQQHNGTNWYIKDAIMTTTESTTGVLKADGSNYVLTFTTEEDSLIYGVEDVALASLITTGKIEAI